MRRQEGDNCSLVGGILLPLVVVVDLLLVCAKADGSPPLVANTFCPILLLILRLGHFFARPLACRCRLPTTA